jgi:hypothetical protein
METPPKICVWCGKLETDDCRSERRLFEMAFPNYDLPPPSNGHLTLDDYNPSLKIVPVGVLADVTSGKASINWEKTEEQGGDDLVFDR